MYFEVSSGCPVCDSTLQFKDRSKFVECGVCGVKIKIPLFYRLAMKLGIVKWLECDTCEGKVTMSKSDATILFKKIALEEFGLDIDSSSMYIEFIENKNQVGATTHINFAEEDIVKGFKFSESILFGSEDLIKNAMKHELVHWEVNHKIEPNLKGLYNMIFPHGYFFIKTAKKRGVEYMSYVKSLGLTQVMVSKAGALFAIWLKRLYRHKLKK